MLGMIERIRSCRSITKRFHCQAVYMKEDKGPQDISKLGTLDTPACLTKTKARKTFQSLVQLINPLA